MIQIQQPSGAIHWINSDLLFSIDLFTESWESGKEYKLFIHSISSLRYELSFKTHEAREVVLKKLLEGE